jgi:hypothetical protein
VLTRHDPLAPSRDRRTAQARDRSVAARLDRPKPVGLFGQWASTATCSHRAQCLHATAAAGPVVTARTRAGTRSASMPTTMVPSETTTIDLYWLPLGASGHSVRWNGRVFE